MSKKLYHEGEIKTLLKSAKCHAATEPGADPEGVDWVGSHPPLEQPTPGA